MPSIRVSGFGLLRGREYPDPDIVFDQVQERRIGEAVLSEIEGR